MIGPPDALVRNWRLKVSALALSVFLWALVQAEPPNQETFSAVPVLVEVADTGWAAAGMPVPATVELRLGGPAREIIRLARDGTSVRVPITTVASSDTVVQLRREWVDLGGRAGVRVESISPASVALSFEPAVARLVPVSPRLRGRVPGGLALVSAVGLNPRWVTVRGPESLIGVLDSVLLEPFDLSRVSSSRIFTVAIDTVGLSSASVSPQEVALGFRVDDRVERLLTGLPVHADVEAGDDAVVTSPQAVDVRIQGARMLVSSLDPSRLRVWVAPELLLGMEPGEERRVPIQVEGVPELVTAVPAIDVVTVRRATDEEGLRPRRDDT
jgi:YbbR domain-containing protein